MKKVILALSLASALVCGTAMAHDNTYSMAKELYVVDHVDFIGFDSQSKAQAFVKRHHLPATVIQEQNSHDFHIMLVDIKKNSGKGPNLGNNGLGSQR